jgi:hypothetical protein
MCACVIGAVRRARAAGRTKHRDVLLVTMRLEPPGLHARPMDIEVHFEELDRRELAMSKSSEVWGMLVAVAVIGSLVLVPALGSDHANLADIGDYALDTALLLASFAIPVTLLAARPRPIRPGWRVIVH